MNYQENLVRIRRELHKNSGNGMGRVQNNGKNYRNTRSFRMDSSYRNPTSWLRSSDGPRSRFRRKSIQRARDSGVSEETLDRMQGYTGCIAEFDTGRAGPVTAFTL